MNPTYKCDILRQLAVWSCLNFYLVMYINFQQFLGTISNIIFNTFRDKMLISQFFENQEIFITGGSGKFENL